MTTEITTQDRTRWQLHAAMALSELLAGAHAAGLPLLSWRITSLGLQGEIVNSYGQRDEAAEYRAWVDHLEATAHRSTITCDGVEHLRSSTTYQMRQGHNVQVTVWAKLSPAAQGLFRESA